MDPADVLLDKLFSSVKLEADSADELDKLAAELEEQRKDVNISQVVGSAASVVGSAALITAGVLTGGAAAPVLAAGGAVASWLGFGVSVGSEVVDAINPRIDEKERRIYKKINDLKTEIQTLTKSLAGEGKKAGVSEEAQEEYVIERILKALAKRCGLTLDTKISFIKLVSRNLKMNSSFKFRLGGSLACFLVYKLVYTILQKRAANKAASKAVTSSVVSAASGQVVKAAGSQASGKALKRIAQGTCGLVFSGAELIYDCVTLNDCETEKSKTLRKRAKEMKTHAETMKKELDALKHMFEVLGEVKTSIGNSRRSLKQKKKLIKFVKEQCIYAAAKAWLENDEKSEAFLKLVDMFCFLHEELNKQREKIDQENIDIIFVAHGAIENTLIQASDLCPQSVQDVVLYSPWNCALTADAAYGISTGRLELKHRVFYCRDEENCKVKHDGHQPTKLPGDWNSMKDAAERGERIPTISLSPLRLPEDGAWKRIEFLQDEHGRPGKNRILIPFILPGESRDFEVPFFVVTLALSLVLHFSNFKATVHLTACLGRSGKKSNLSESYLNDQYSYTIDKTGMTSSKEMLDGTPISRRFEKLFGRKSSGLSCTIS